MHVVMMVNNLACRAHCVRSSADESESPTTTKSHNPPSSDATKMLQAVSERNLPYKRWGVRDLSACSLEAGEAAVYKRQVRLLVFLHI